MRRLYIVAACFACLGSTWLTAAETTPAEPVSGPAVEAIRKLGGNILPIAQDDSRLDVSLNLASQDVTDTILPEVAKLPEVVWLNLAGTKITDAGLAALANMKSLEKLHLEKTAIGDAGLAHLAGLENLTYLNIYSTQVTDAGLKHLHNLKKLKHLYIWQSKVTEAGAEELQKAIPGLHVVGEVKLAAPVEPKEDAKPEDKK